MSSARRKLGSYKIIIDKTNAPSSSTDASPLVGSAYSDHSGMSPSPSTPPSVEIELAALSPNDDLVSSDSDSDVEVEEKDQIDLEILDSLYIATNKESNRDILKEEDDAVEIDSSNEVEPLNIELNNADVILEGSEVHVINIQNTYDADQLNKLLAIEKKLTEETEAQISYWTLGRILNFACGLAGSMLAFNISMGEAVDKAQSHQQYNLLTIALAITALGACVTPSVKKKAGRNPSTSTCLSTEEILEINNITGANVGELHTASTLVLLEDFRKQHANPQQATPVKNIEDKLNQLKDSESPHSNSSLLLAGCLYVTALIPHAYTALKEVDLAGMNASNQFVSFMLFGTIIYKMAQDLFIGIQEPLAKYSLTEQEITTLQETANIDANTKTVKQTLWDIKGFYINGSRGLFAAVPVAELVIAANAEPVDVIPAPRIADDVNENYRPANLAPIMSL